MKSISETYQSIVTEVNHLGNVYDEKYKEYILKGGEELYKEQEKAETIYNNKKQEMYNFEREHHRVLFG